MKPLYIAAYHQSRFGKLGAPRCRRFARRRSSAPATRSPPTPAPIDVGAIGCRVQLLAEPAGPARGPRREVPGLGGKPIEAVENACASGGQAVLAVVQKLLARRRRRGHRASATRRCAATTARSTASGSARCSATSRIPTNAPGKVYVFPHLFAEVMKEYMAGLRASPNGNWRGSRSPEYAHAQAQSGRPDARRRADPRAGDDDRRPQPLHRRRSAAQDLRLLADHRRLRRAACWRPTRGSRGSASRARRRVRLAGYGPGDRPAAARPAATCCVPRERDAAMARALRHRERRRRRTSTWPRSTTASR